MPLWLLFTCAFLALAVGAVATVGYFTTIVLKALVSGTAYIDAAFQSGIIAIFLLLVIGALFFVLERIVVKPIRHLTRAVQAFAEQGQQLQMPSFKYTPLEIEQLMSSFATLVGSVEASHRRDVEVSRVKSDFISTAAHQLRTPLTGIRWSLEALQKGQLTQEQVPLVNSANDKIKDLVAIVSTLLDISSIESGKYRYHFEPVDVAVLLAEIANDFMPVASERKVSISVDPMSTLPPIRADRERIKWVLNNLVDNAINYTPAGGTVRLLAEAGAGRVIIRVRDTGIGISEQDRGNIFERFYRAPNAVAKENAGNGLGLYIARTIANDHGGDLNFAANDHGPGTTFALSIPVENGRRL